MCSLVPWNPINYTTNAHSKLWPSYPQRSFDKVYKIKENTKEWGIVWAKREIVITRWSYLQLMIGRSFTLQWISWKQQETFTSVVLILHCCWIKFDSFIFDRNHPCVDISLGVILESNRNFLIKLCSLKKLVFQVRKKPADFYIIISNPSQISILLKPSTIVFL